MFDDLQEYAEAVFDVYQEIKADILENPLTYGAMAAEYAPGGIGVISSLGNQGYKVATGQSTLGEAGRELGTDAAMGFIGLKACRGLKKAGLFVSSKVATRLAQKRAAKIEEGIKKSGNLLKRRYSGLSVKVKNGRRKWWVEHKGQEPQVMRSDPTEKL